MLSLSAVMKQLTVSLRHLQTPHSACCRDVLQARLKGEGGAYGQARGSGTSQEVAERLESIKQNVQELAALEYTAQRSFLKLKEKWGASAGA
jgi:hypothetical protein